METLKLVKNQFTSLPSPLLQLGRDHTCKVFLTKNQLPQSERVALNDVRGAGSLFVYTTPRISIVDAETATLGELLNHWYVVAEQDCPTDVRNSIAKLDDTAKETLRIHLFKLIGTLDYEHPSRGQTMAKRVSIVLKAMAADKDVMEDCLAASYEATSSCTDRALLGLNMMEQAVQVAKVRRMDDPKPLLDMGVGLWRMKLVKEIAQKEYKNQQGLKQLVTMHEADQIEIELAYLLGLRDSLDLPLAENQHMLNRSYSEVTDRMLDNARKKVETELKDHPEREYLFLAQWPPLREKLADLYFGDVDAINDAYQNKFVDLGDKPLESPEVIELKRAWEEELDDFYMGVIKNMKVGEPLPYHKQEEVLKMQQEEYARLRAAAANKKDSSG
nr:NEL-type E3 ubiquitin ligase domain-containing protein [Sansalvadorimonas sp. 2012CJ34-2]